MRGDAGFVNGTQVDRARERARLESQPVRVRPVGEGDAEALGEFVGGLSLRTRYLRFFAGVPRVTPAMLRRMSGTRLPGGDLVDALVVTEAGAIIGHGMATDTRDSAGTAVTEIGVVVADRWQGHGIGSALTRTLAARAQARGATGLMMDVLAENRQMLALISKHLPAARSWQAGPYVTVHVPLRLLRRNSQVNPPSGPIGPTTPTTPTGNDSVNGMSSNGAGPRERQRTYQWDDPAIAAAAARKLDGLTFFREIMAGRLPAPPIMATLGISAVAFEFGRAVFDVTPAEYHYNPIGSVHGGVYATICDSACGCAVHTMLPAGAYYTSLDLDTRFIRPITSSTGRLRCEGTVDYIGSRTALARARLVNADGKLFAQATSNCLIFRPEE